ncbi:alpha/beta hydrolase [Aquimarina agarilytica]|uniref:alpha/beta hydrolase n=1 Tax=Aquimarina agarilytica TaxID=1087449 RepID=UPI000289D506|nr:alpha/beta hydrolase [Aquimarina agarilytica]
MIKEPIHIYFVPGMSANETIFEAIKLPEHYIVHVIPWKMPNKEESISDYARRMAVEVTVPNAVLLGVSFGGIIVQEMSRFLKLRKLIIVSSIKTKHELPKSFKALRKSRLYKVLPTSLVDFDWQKLFLGKGSKKIATIYRKYLTVTDKQYMDWSIEKVLCWEQEKPIEGSVHIHGEKDVVFPIKNIDHCIRIPNGSHVIILSRARWFNLNLPKLIET